MRELPKLVMGFQTGVKHPSLSFLCFNWMILGTRNKNSSESNLNLGAFIISHNTKSGDQDGLYSMF